MEVGVLGVLEFNSIAAGVEAMDYMVKAAPVKIVDATTICPGKFLILITGEVAAVDASPPVLASFRFWTKLARNGTRR